MRHTANLTEKGLGSRTNPFQAAFIEYITSLGMIADGPISPPIPIGLDPDETQQVED